MESQTNISWKELKCNDSGERGSHTSTTYKNYVVTIGGNKDLHAPLMLDDITVLDVHKGTLQAVKPSNALFVGRFDHSACLYKEQKIVVFGGYNEDSLNETGVLTIKSSEPFVVEWEILKTKGDEKIHRFGHSANIYENSMYVFGGVDQEQQSSNQLWQLDLDKLEWTRCQTKGESPTERNGHGSVLYKKQLIIFGGFSFQKQELMNDLWLFNLENLEWLKINPVNDLPPVRKNSPAIENKGKIYIFGGLLENECKSDFWEYCIEKNEWKRLPDKDEAPSPRGGHTLAYCEGNLVVWGGFDTAYSGLPSIFTLQIGK